MMREWWDGALAKNHKVTGLDASWRRTLARASWSQPLSESKCWLLRASWPENFLKYSISTLFDKCQKSPQTSGSHMSCHLQQSQQEPTQDWRHCKLLPQIGTKFQPWLVRNRILISFFFKRKIITLVLNYGHLKSQTEPHTFICWDHFFPPVCEELKSSKNCRFMAISDYPKELGKVTLSFWVLISSIAEWEHYKGRFSVSCGSQESSNTMVSFAMSRIGICWYNMFSESRRKNFPTKLSLSYRPRANLTR